MGTYDKFADSPGQIRKEGQEITIKFTRTDDTTGVITWNIPRPSAGCNSETQAYDGIVVTVDNVPANYNSTSPKDGNYYDADPTADRDLHVGSKLDTALVVGAFYNDKKTTSLTITSLSPKTPYYISGYAVDAQARYHREGVHAYSLPTGVNDKLTDDQSAYQDISIVSNVPLSINNLSGLESNRDYSFAIQMCCKRYDFTIHGRDALTYKDLVNAINKAFAESICPPRGPLPPNAGEYYLDVPNENLFLWDGWKNIEQPLIWSTSDPTVPAIGSYWFSPKQDKLFIYETGGWVEVTNIITQESDPTKPVCGQVWFDGTDAWEWDGNHWCKLCVIISERNPLLPPVFGCNTYWYDTTKQELFHWSDAKKWEDALAIYWAVDPNNLEEGAFWYDETNSKMMVLENDEFVTLTNVYYKEPTKAGNFPKSPIPEAGVFWFVPSTGKFYQRNASNDTWNEAGYISFPTDPRDRSSCDLWWNSTQDKLYVWDAVNLQWVEALQFFQAPSDPRIPGVLPDCAVWYNPTTKKIVKILSVNCDEADVIFSGADPTNLPAGYIWRWKDTFKEWDGANWIDLKPIISDENPYIIEYGIFWYNPDMMELFQRVDGAWVQISYSTIPLSPKKGDIWFNTTDDLLMEWDGVTWIPTTAFAYVEWIPRDCKEKYEALRFKTKRKGCADCDTQFKIIVESGNLFTYLKPSVIYNDPVGGGSGLVGGPTYQQLGVGDDGDPTERRALADTIRSLLGAPSQTVELTKEQIDIAIDNALLVIRKRSSYGYLRGLFFLNILPNQQVYLMTNECVGFNKIVDINTIYRTRGAAFKSAYAWNDSFSFAALQQMYTLGTFDILTYHLTTAYMEELATIFAERIMFQWTERTRTLKLHSYLAKKERVLIDCVLERTEQDLLTDRETVYFIQRWALMECKLMLAGIRGKFQSLPGPNGSTTLNAQDLQTQAESERQQLEDELSDIGLMGSLVDTGARAHFVIG